MWPKLFRRRQIEVGAEHHIPALERPLARLRKLDLRPLRQLMASTRERPFRERLLYSLTSLTSLEHLELYEEWCSREPLSPDAWLLRGRARVDWAWDARTAARATEVTEEGWRLFMQRLAMAQRDLLWSAELLPADPSPYIHRIRVHMGGGQGTEKIYDLFGEATARAPTSFEAHRAALYALSERWHGSHDEMFAFARAAIEKVAFDNDLAALLAYAHTLRYDHYLGFDENEEAAAAYCRDRENQREVAQLFDRSFASQHYREQVDSFPAWNDFTFWFYHAEDVRRLRRCLDVLRGRYAGSFWDSYQNPRALLGKVEEMARG